MFIEKALSLILRTLKKGYYKLRYTGKLEIAKDVDIDFKSHILIKGQGQIALEEGVHLRSKKKGYHSGMPFSSSLFADGDKAEIRVGRNTRLNGCYIHSKKNIEIGNGCAIASGVNILDSNGHKTISTNRILDRDEPESIIIGNNVWIGLNAIILKGTRIGDNSIVGANSVVKGEYPPNSLLMGNPAKLIKNLKI